MVNRRWRPHVQVTVLFVVIAAASVSASASAQVVPEEGAEIAKLRALAAEMLPSIGPSIDEGYFERTDTPTVGLMPLVDASAAAEAGLGAGNVLLTRSRSFQSIEPGSKITLEVSQIDPAKLTEKYVEARLSGDRATQIDVGGQRAALIVPPKDLAVPFRTIVLSDEANLITVSVQFDSRLDPEKHKRAVSDIASRQIGIGGIDRSAEMAAISAEIVQNVGLDSEEIVGLTIARVLGQLLLLALLAKVYAALKSKDSRSRTFSRLFKSNARPPTRPDVIDVSRIAQRRRVVSRLYTLRRWMLSLPMWTVLSLTVLSAGFYLVGDRNDSLFSVAVVCAVLVGLHLLSRNLLRRFELSAAPTLPRSDSAPKNGFPKGVAFSLSYGLSMLGVVLGICLVLGAAFARQFDQMTGMVRFVPRVQALTGAESLWIFGVALIMIAVAPTRWLKMHRNQTLSLSVDNDTRLPVLFLRSFSDDALRLNREFWHIVSALDRLSFSVLPFYEEVVAQRLRNVGPVVAIGEPGERPRSLGAARSYFGTEWDEAIRVSIHRSQVIVVSMGDSPGVQWEIKQIVGLEALRKTVFLVPPNTSHERVWELLSLLGAVNAPPAANRPLAIVIDPKSRFATFYCDRWSTESSYSAALDQALDRQLTEHNAAPPGLTSQVLPPILSMPLSSVEPPDSKLIRRLLVLCFLATSFVIGPALIPVAGIAQAGPARASLGAGEFVGASRYRTGHPSLIFGGEYLGMRGVFVRDDIRPVSAAYGSATSRFAVLTDDNDVHILTREAGDSISSWPLGFMTSGAIDWVGEEVVAADPALRRLVAFSVDGASRSIELDFTPHIVLGLSDSLVAIAAVGGGVHTLDVTSGKLVATAPTRTTPITMIAVQNFVVAQEAVSLEVVKVDPLGGGSVEVTSPNGALIALSNSSFGVFANGVLLQYAGRQLELTRYTEIRSASALFRLDEGLFAQIGDEVVVYPVCFGLVCTQGELR